MWALVGSAELEEEEVAPKIHAGPDAAFWRIHFPRELWDEARKHDVIGIDWPIDSTNQSVQRLKRVKVGDRIVVYFRGAVIGSVGVVTQPFYDVRAGDEADAAVLGGQYPQRIGVAWADAPAEPVELFETLKGASYTNLYNRLKNPHTVIPLSRDDYADVLALLRVDDVGTDPTDEVDASPAWPKLTTYRDFAQLLDDRAYSAAELFSVAHEYGDGLDTLLDEEELVDRLRLINVNYICGWRPTRCATSCGEAGQFGQYARCFC
jgi:hypothetical protein